METRDRQEITRFFFKNLDSPPQRHTYVWWPDQSPGVDPAETRTCDPDQAGSSRAS